MLRVTAPVEHKHGFHFIGLFCPAEAQPQLASDRDCIDHRIENLKIVWVL